MYSVQDSGQSFVVHTNTRLLGTGRAITFLSELEDKVNQVVKKEHFSKISPTEIEVIKQAVQFVKEKCKERNPIIYFFQSWLNPWSSAYKIEAFSHRISLQLTIVDLEDGKVDEGEGKTVENREKETEQDPYEYITLSASGRKLLREASYVVPNGAVLYYKQGDFFDPSKSSFGLTQKHYNSVTCFVQYNDKQDKIKLVTEEEATRLWPKNIEYLEVYDVSLRHSKEYSIALYNWLKKEFSSN